MNFVVVHNYYDETAAIFRLLAEQTAALDKLDEHGEKAKIVQYEKEESVTLFGRLISLFKHSHLARGPPVRHNNISV